MPFDGFPTLAKENPEVCYKNPVKVRAFPEPPAEGTQNTGNYAIKYYTIHICGPNLV
jgi:hypothetical protein